MPDDAFDIIMKIHVRAPFRLIRAAAPYMRVKGESLHPFPSYSISLTRTHLQVTPRRRTAAS
jgi:NAD(P)-dependent dehydrogenase (short-subunit alcohol dehydrogenase family)